jgi:hypothetical protein
MQFIIESLKFGLTIEKNKNLLNGFIVLDNSSSKTSKLLSIKISSFSKNTSHSWGWPSI